MHDRCPHCLRSFDSPPQSEEAYPRFRKCHRCHFPLDLERLLERVRSESTTEAALGFMDYEQISLKAPDRALRNLDAALRYGPEPIAEFEHGVILRIMNDYFIFNFAALGGCQRYWTEYLQQR